MRVVLAVTGGRDLTRADFDAAIAKLADIIDAPPGEAIPRYPVPYEAGKAEGVPRAQWGKRRNHTIMKRAKAMGAEEVCDVFVLAGWNGMSAGTAHGIAAAVAHGLRVEVHGVRRTG